MTSGTRVAPRRLSRQHRRQSSAMERCSRGKRQLAAAATGFVPWSPADAQVRENSGEWSAASARNEKPHALLQRWLNAVAGRAFVLFRRLRAWINVAAWFPDRSRAVGSVTNRQHRAVATLADGSMTWTSSGSRGWRRRGHPFAQCRLRAERQGSWNADELSNASALKQLQPRLLQRRLRAVFVRAFVLSKGFLLQR